MIGTLASGANASLVARNGTEKYLSTTADKTLPVDRFWCLRCLNDCINLPNMIRTFASGANASLVAKNGNKKNDSYTLEKIITSGQILVFEVSKQPY